jgi:hypothetical protein
MNHTVLLIFLISLMSTFFLIYRWYNDQYPSDILVERFDSQYKRRPHFYPYNSQPKMYKKEKENEEKETSLMNVATTGIDRDVFKKAEKDITYLGNIESGPAPYFKITINETTDTEILDFKDPNLRGLMNFPKYYE